MQQQQLPFLPFSVGQQQHVPVPALPPIQEVHENKFNRDKEVDDKKEDEDQEVDVDIEIEDEKELKWSLITC